MRVPKSVRRTGGVRNTANRDTGRVRSDRRASGTGQATARTPIRAQCAGDRNHIRQPRRLWILVGVPWRRRMSRRWRAPPHEAQLDATPGGLAAPLRDVGFSFHSLGGRYWEERPAMSFPVKRSTSWRPPPRNWQRLCLEACEHIVRNGRYGELAIPGAFSECVGDSWKQRDPSVFGRFDLAWDGKDRPSFWNTTPIRRPHSSRRAWRSGSGWKTASGWNPPRAAR